MAELNVSQEVFLSKPELENELMSLAKGMDREAVEYLVRMPKREVLWQERAGK